MNEAKIPGDRPEIPNEKEGALQILEDIISAEKQAKESGKESEFKLIVLTSNGASFSEAAFIALQTLGVRIYDRAINRDKIAAARIFVESIIGSYRRTPQAQPNSGETGLEDDKFLF